MANTLYLKNDAVIQSFLEQQVHELETRRHGRVSAQQLLECEEAKRAAQSFRSHTDSLANLAKDMQDWVPPMSQVVSSPQGSCAFVDRFYSYKVEDFGRRYVSRGGMQACSRRVRRLLLPGVNDLDIKNAMVSIVSQALEKMDIGDLWPSTVMSAWEEYRADAAGMRSWVSNELHCSGKAVLLRIAHGGVVHDDGSPELTSWLKKLSMGSRFARWVAISQLPELHALLSVARPWPENSTMAYWWHTMEDLVLSHIHHFVNQRDTAPEHTSLHFDGIMLKGEQFSEDTVFKHNVEQYVNDQLGLAVTLEYKNDKSLLERIADVGVFKEDAVVLAPEDRDFWLRPKHVIPYHIAIAKQNWPDVYRVCAANMEAGSLSYGDWSSALLTAGAALDVAKLSPRYGLHIPAVGVQSFLLHVMKDKKPSCVSVLPTPDGKWQVVSGTSGVVVTAAQLLLCFDDAIDKRNVVSFSFADDATEASRRLLDLRAGE